MATLYRFSFENEIVPDGVTITRGQIWSGFGRFGDTTSALVDSSSLYTAQPEITASLPSNCTGVRGSYYTKYTISSSYPVQLVSVGPFDLNLINNSTVEIRENGSQVAAQDITELQDNRWNLVRFSADFEPSGNASTASFEFNGINLSWAGVTGATNASKVTIRGVKGYLSTLDDVGINDKLGTLDNSMPGSIRGMVGGMMGDGDIQNWQQNVESLPPTKIPLKYQGSFVYIPSNDVVLSQNSIYTGSAPSYSTFTTINAQTSVTRSVWTSSFLVSTSTYSPYDHMVYLYGSSGSYLMWQKYDPNLDAIVDGGKYDAGSTLPGYKFYSGFCAISSTFSESNNRILILSACSSDIQLHLDPQDSQDYIKASLRVVSHNINDKQLSVGAFGYGSEFATTVHPYTGLPADKPLSNIFYSYLDKKVYMFSSYLTPNLMVLDPSTLFIATQNSVYWQGGNSPVLPTSSFTTCEINNSLFISSYDYQQQIGDIHQIDLNTRTGSRVINGHSPSYQPSGFLGAYTTNLAYVTGRSAVIAVGNVVSYLINPFEAHAGKTTQSIIEYIPQIYNAADAIYCPRNAAIIISGTDAVYNFQGALQASVVNALMNLDTLKAGATASGDVCTIQIAKPSGSFTSGFTYEGMNVRVDNASSLTTASLILGARDGGNNLQLSSSVVTWGNSQQTAVRSIFSYQNAGTAKWTADQFKNLQFYMQAGPEV